MIDVREVPELRCVYAIRHVVSERRYVGSTSNLRKRIVEHLKLLRVGKHYCSTLQHGWDSDAGAFVIDVLQMVRPGESLVRAEHGWLIDDGNLMNASKERWRASLSAAKQGPLHNYFGKARPEKTRRLIAAAKVGEQNPMYGVLNGDHPRARPVEIDGVAYGAVVEAARVLGRAKRTIYNWLESGRAKYI